MLLLDVMNRNVKKATQIIEEMTSSYQWPMERHLAKRVTAVLMTNMMIWQLKSRSSSVNLNIKSKQKSRHMWYNTNCLSPLICGTLIIQISSINENFHNSCPIYHGQDGATWLITQAIGFIQTSPTCILIMSNNLHQISLFLMELSIGQEDVYGIGEYNLCSLQTGQDDRGTRQQMVNQTAGHHKQG